MGQTGHTPIEQVWRLLPWYLRAALLAHMALFERPAWWAVNRWLRWHECWFAESLPVCWLDIVYWLADRRGDWPAPYQAIWLLRYTGYRHHEGTSQ